MIFSKLSLIWHKLATSLVFPCLTPPPNAGAVGSIPGLGTKIPTCCMMWPRKQQQNQTNKKQKRVKVMGQR